MLILPLFNLRCFSPRLPAQPACYFLMLVGLVIVAPAANAACSNPAGERADIVYNGDYEVPQYCDGTNWISMADTGVQTDTLLALTCASGEVAKWNGTIWACAADDAGSDKVSKSGDTMSGALTLPGVPTANNQAATKEYVDTVAASGGAGTYQLECIYDSGGNKMLCIRMDTSTGSTEMKRSVPGSVWTTLETVPW